MAAGDTEDSLGKDFEDWLNTANNDSIFMLQKTQNADGAVTMKLLLKGEKEFTLHCPSGYPEYEGHFYVEAEHSIHLWANALNEFLLDHVQRLSLAEVLNKALALYTLERKESDRCSEEDDGCCEDFEEEEPTAGSFVLLDDDLFTSTEWELQVAKKRWAKKEMEVREEVKKKSRLCAGTTNGGSLNALNQVQNPSQQIFTSSAASGILTNDLVKIMKHRPQCGIMADPIDDNIYQWRVHLFNFDPDSLLAKDLNEVERLFGYSSIELQLDFAIDLYPFYPPIVKVVRPRLQASMMQRVTNMEMLKLSFWNATKDMLSVLMDIKQFLQKWARLEVTSERNDKRRYPRGSYVDIEHHLLKLALVSEVNPRANTKYHLDVDLGSTPAVSNVQHKHKKKHKEYWAAGVGYGHPNRPEWDINAYIAAKQEKDKQVESVLYQILLELKQLYANHAPQLKPCNLRRDAVGNSNAAELESESIDPVEDMYNILEGSALIPFIEQYLKADSFLEICRHTSVYRVIVDIIKEIALQNQLVPLLGSLPDQDKSLYELLKNLEEKANMLLQHICKTGNGSIPKPLKKETSPSCHGSLSKKSKDSCFPLECIPDEVSSTSAESGICIQSTAEEKLAREFQVLFKDVKVAFSRANISPCRVTTDASQVNSSLSQQASSEDVEMVDISLSTQEDESLESLYKKAMAELQFGACDIDVDGVHSHHFAKDFKKQETLGQSQVFHIAKELTSLSSSLPLALSSSIFVRTDDDRLTLMRALITGPEGTPYSGGCYQFDIFFPSSYPHVPPLVNLQTTGGGTVRFNPNLYNSGRVCLSLLGTWEGQQGEQWNETASTVLQVLVSIQSLILVPEPYFNEPGYEQEIGTDTGIRHSNEYNTDVWYNNIKHAIIGQLHNPSQGFEEVIRTHFYLKKDRILKELGAWIKSNKSSRLEHMERSLRQEFAKLQPPPNLNNLCHSASTSAAGDSVTTQPEIHQTENIA